MTGTGHSPSFFSTFQRVPLSFVRWIFCALPERSALILGERLGDLLRAFLRSKVDILRQNVGNSGLILPEGQSEKDFEREVFRHFGRLGAEFLRLKVTTDEDVRENVTVSGLEHFREQYDRGKGVILLSGHIGNWELSLRRMNLEAPGKVHPVIRRIKNPVVHDFVDDHRRIYGKGVSILADLGVRPLVRALNRGDVLVILLDQNAGENEGEFVPFFGRTACTYSSLAKLSLLLDLPVLPASGSRMADGTHHIVIGPPISPMGDCPREEALARMTALYTKALEEMIRAHPEQWIWMHRRWKTRPSGNPLPGETNT
jgi:KDO2-lipid IV(A) lauroyltransferase